jgi:transposase
MDKESQAVIYVSLELSRSGWLVAVLLPGEQRASRYKVPSGDSRRVLELMARARGAAERLGGGAVRVCSCYEAGYDGFWLHRVLLAAGIESHVVDPSSLQVNRRARRAKSDGIDVESLLRALAAWDRGERGGASMVVVPPPEVEDDRRVTRERARLIRERTAHTNRIKGLLAGVGVYGFDVQGPAFLERLAELTTGDGRPLPPLLAAEIRREFARLTFIEPQLAEVERVRDARRRRPGRPPAGLPKPASDSLRDRIEALQKLRGIGPEIANVLARELLWRDFKNRRQLGSYCGLDPSPYASGATTREQGISKAGNAYARKALIEAAWLWVLHQPESALAQWWRSRVGVAKGRLRRVMIVALARKLVIALWRYLKTGNAPQGAVLAS